MSAVAINVFGPMRILCAARPVPGLGGERVRDLIGYLALRRGQPQARERLAEVLWGDQDDADARKVLRQTLWRIHAACDGRSGPPPSAVLRIEPASVELADDADLWLDIAAFEALTAPTIGVPGFALSPELAARLEQAVALYAGELLNGCYRDWCFPDRERLHQRHLSALDKLLAYAEVCGDFEAGLARAARILSHEPAREATHRALMRLHLLNGDRTAALRQFELCARALADAFGVAPGPRTLALLAMARADDVEGARAAGDGAAHRDAGHGDGEREVA